MTKITLERNTNLRKTHFKNINELFVINFITKPKKLTPKQLIKKYNLDEPYNGKTTNISNNIDKIVYNI